MSFRQACRCDPGGAQPFSGFWKFHGYSIKPGRPAVSRTRLGGFGAAIESPIGHAPASLNGGVSMASGDFNNDGSWHSATGEVDEDNPCHAPSRSSSTSASAANPPCSSSDGRHRGLGDRGCQLRRLVAEPYLITARPGAGHPVPGRAVPVGHGLGSRAGLDVPSWNVVDLHRRSSVPGPVMVTTGERSELHPH